MALDRIAIAVGDIPNDGVLASIKLVKQIAVIEAMKVAGGDRRLRNAGKTRLDTRDNYTPGSGQASAVVFAVPPGPWSWVTDGTRPHVIGFGRARRKSGVVGNYSKALGFARKNSGGTLRQRLRMPGAGPVKYGTGWRNGPVFHPGTKGQHAWTNVKVRSARMVPKLFERELAKALHG